jgi:hypothetical protein
MVCILRLRLKHIFAKANVASATTITSTVAKAIPTTAREFAMRKLVATSTLKALPYAKASQATRAQRQRLYQALEKLSCERLNG